MSTCHSGDPEKKQEQKQESNKEVMYDPEKKQSQDPEMDDAEATMPYIQDAKIAQSYQQASGLIEFNLQRKKHTRRVVRTPGFGLFPASGRLGKTLYWFILVVNLSCGVGYPLRTNSSCALDALNHCPSGFPSLPATSCHGWGAKSSAALASSFCPWEGFYHVVGLPNFINRTPWPDQCFSSLPVGLPIGFSKEAPPSYRQFLSDHACSSCVSLRSSRFGLSFVKLLAELGLALALVGGKRATHRRAPSLVRISRDRRRVQVSKPRFRMRLRLYRKTAARRKKRAAAQRSAPHSRRVILSCRIVGGVRRRGARLRCRIRARLQKLDRLKWKLQGRTAGSGPRPGSEQAPVAVDVEAQPVPRPPLVVPSSERQWYARVWGAVCVWYSELFFDPFCAVRVGEASHPGPGGQAAARRKKAQLKDTGLNQKALEAIVKSVLLALDRRQVVSDSRWWASQPQRGRRQWQSHDSDYNWTWWDSDHTTSSSWQGQDPETGWWDPEAWTSWWADSSYQGVSYTDEGLFVSGDHTGVQDSQVSSPEAALRPHGFSTQGYS